MAGISIRSSAFNDHDLMPERFSMDGGNASPPLEWSGVPDDTTELVLLVEDPDAGRTPFLHWLVTGIDPSCTGMAEGEVPRGGREWHNGFGRAGWGGPRPPRNDNPHRYFFRLYAVNRTIELDGDGTVHAPQVHQALTDRETASATMVGTFAR